MVFPTANWRRNYVSCGEAESPGIAATHAMSRFNVNRFPAKKAGSFWVGNRHSPCTRHWLRPPAGTRHGRGRTVTAKAACSNLTADFCVSIGPQRNGLGSAGPARIDDRLLLKRGDTHT